MECPRCQAQNREGARFCRECGAPFGVVCSSCGAKVQAGSKFCDNCGTPLAVAPGPRPERARLERAQAATAEVEIIGTSKVAAEAERRQLTVLFCDLVGSTQLSGQLDPEDLRAVVRAYQEAAAAVIQQYAGHIAQYLGDGLLVYFGYPTAHEDDARRAVHTGLGIVEAIATLNTRLMGQYAVQLAVRLGIHTGPVVVGVMGGGGRHEHLALGETPNIAARLEGLAPANAVVISAVTARLVRGTFALEDFGDPHPPGDCGADDDHACAWSAGDTQP